MNPFTGKVAVVTGGGTGMGRELVVQLVARGCAVATCDVNGTTLAETAALAGNRAGVTTHLCDVRDEAAVNRFRDEVLEKHGTDSVNFVFNNAGIDGCVSFVVDDPQAWERSFGVCWWGVYNCTRAFLPLLIAGEGGVLVNTSSVMGFRACNPGFPNTAYSAAKFAVKGFTESLITDLRFHAPHVRAALVMPGAVATQLGINSARAFNWTHDEARGRAAMLANIGLPVDAEAAAALAEVGRLFEPTSAAQAAATILDGVAEGRFRILVGGDAHELDAAVRSDPDHAYDVDGSCLMPRWLAPLVLLRWGYEGGASGEFEIRDGDERICLRAAADELEIMLRPANAPDAIVETGPRTLRGILTGRLTLNGADGVTVRGDRPKLERLLSAVRRPEPVDGSPGRPQSFDGMLAVVTGGGTGMGRELVVQLAARGCSVAACDLNETTLADTAVRARAAATGGANVTVHHCDVADPASVRRFRDEVLAQHDRSSVNYLFNNAGILGGGSFVAGDRGAWEKTFAVCWGGVYNCSRAFLPLIVAGAGGCIVNTSSICGIYAGGGGLFPNTAYSTAKFAVKGFSEALITDLRLHAPHVTVVALMPGSVTTDLAANSSRVLEAQTAGSIDLGGARRSLARMGFDVDGLDDAELSERITTAGRAEWRITVSLTSAEAATRILDAVSEGRWRVLVGDDAIEIDRDMREDPDQLYDVSRLDRYFRR